MNNILSEVSVSRDFITKGIENLQQNLVTVSPVHGARRKVRNDKKSKEEDKKRHNQIDESNRISKNFSAMSDNQSRILKSSLPTLQSADDPKREISMEFNEETLKLI